MSTRRAAGPLSRRGTCTFASGSADQVLRTTEATSIGLILREQIDAADGDGKTALYWATMAGHGEAAATLLELSADPNKPTREGVTPLMRAVRAQNLSLVRLLLRGGADCQQRDRLGRTAVDLARQKAPPDGGVIGALLGDWPRRG